MTWNRNRLTEKLGIDYPIIQGPLGGLSSQRLTAAVSNFGGLGSFGALSLSPEEIKNVISQIRSLTSKPFAVNLWVSIEDDGARTSDEAAFNRSLAPLASYFAQLQAPRPQYKHTRPSDSKIRLAFSWRKKYQSSASYSEFRQKKSLTSVERKAS
jgi:nitronate monooxygenase